MNSKKIAISQPWISRSMDQNIHKDIWIRKYISGLFLKYNILTSEIYIHEYPNKISIIFLIFVPKFAKRSLSRNNRNDRLQAKQDMAPILRIKKLVKLTKSLLILKYNKNIHINLKIVPSIFHDAHICVKWLKEEKNVHNLKFILKKLKYKFPVSS